LSKKIPHPYNKELAIGAVTMDDEIVDYYPNISKNYINSEISIGLDVPYSSTTKSTAIDNSE
jgi:predicted phosphoribosyltransferase